MSYGSIDRVAKLFVPRRDIDMLLDDESLGASNEEITKREELILTMVDGTINATLQGLYTVPFSTPVPALIEQIADRLAAVAIYSRRPGELPPTIKALSDWAEDRLRRILRREIQLLADDPPLKSQPPLVSKSDDDRTFSSELLGKMPK
jgi:hypothetical protein